MEKLFILLIAVLLIGNGIKSIVTKQATITKTMDKNDPRRSIMNDGKYDESYSGTFAVVIGIGQILGGIVVLFVGVGH